MVHRQKSSYSIILILIVTSLVLVGCSTPMAAQLLFREGNKIGGASSTSQYLQGSKSLSGSSTGSGGMIPFNGSVFVAVSEINHEVWNKAGWKISDQSIDTDTQEVPENCTLYGHKGVDGQWVGRCRGKVLIPKDGAKHIAVMHTSLDGSTILIQVAPPP